MADTFPEGFIPLGDAFAEALSSIEDCNSILKRELVDQQRINQFFDDYDALVRNVERLMRDALADGTLLAFIKVPNGHMEQPVDRESWRQQAFGVPGIDSVPHHQMNPGPDTSGRPVFLKIDNFKNWLTIQKPELLTAAPGLDQPRKMGEFDSELYLIMSELLKRGDATSVSQAAKLVADRAKTRGGTRESVAKRLARGYQKRQKTESQEILRDPN